MRLIPSQILDRFKLSPYLVDTAGHELLLLKCPPGSSTLELKLFHRFGFPDPILYAHLADTIHGRIKVLLYVINNPDSPRFDVDVLPDGTPTMFGTAHRNLEAETAAMRAGLAPGQVRGGLRIFEEAMACFEKFLSMLGQDMYFLEPLYYHTAVIFERHGLSFEQGEKRMEDIHAGFTPDGELAIRLDKSTPFRTPDAARSIRLRSWAIHDGLLGEPFTGITMYKMIGEKGDTDTSPGVPW